YALGVKATLGSLVLFCLVSAFRLSRSSRWPRRDEWVLLLPMMLVFLLVSSQTGINKHMRYLLPAYPFAVIWLSQVIAQWKNSVAKCAVVVSVSSAIVSSLWASPHSMSYFNELVGGPRQGHKHLINSNCDWGQDLFFLRDKLERLGWSEIELVYWGRYNAELSGIDFRLPPESVVREEGAEVPLSVVAPRPGRYAASVSQIHGYRFPAPNGVGGKENTKGGYEYFKSFEPVDTAGYSMLLYELNEDSVRGVRKAHGLDRIDRISFEVVRNMDFSTRRPVALGAMHRSFAAVVAFQTGEIELYGVPKFKSRWVSPNAGVSCSSLDVSSDDSMIASGYADGSIRVWDASGSADEIELRWEERASQVPVVSLSFSMDGKKLATGDEDGVVTVFDTTSGKAITFTRLSLSATSVDWINSDEIAIGTGDWRKGQRGKICIYSFESGSIDTLVDSRNFIYDLATKQNGRVIGRTTNGSLGIWGDDRRVEHRLLGQGARKLSLSKDEQWLVSGDDAGRVRAWATKVGVMVFEGRVSSSALLDVVFCQRRDSNDPGWVLTIDRSGQVKLLKVIASRGEG
ncbi:WD40 repeat domain-containing protein, partial [Rhodopirellula bahusiensis]